MGSYAVYTKWYHEKGVKPADEMAQGMRDNMKPNHPADDVIWWQIHDNHHQSVIIYSSEHAAKKHRAEVEAHRAKSSQEYSIRLVEEYVGPVLAQMSKLWKRIETVSLLSSQTRKAKVSTNQCR